MYAALVAFLLGVMPFPSAPVHLHQTVAPVHFNMRSPVSGSIIVAHAVRAGLVRVPFVYSRGVSPFALNCTPAPCTTPNVQASGGGSPVNEVPIAENPSNAAQLLSGGNDFNCGSIQGFYNSSNGGSTWIHTCLGTLPGGGGVGDPVVAYDTNNVAYIGGVDQVGSNTYDVAFEKSTNNGMSWSSAALAVAGIGAYLFCDKPWMQIDHGSTSPHKNNIYISTTDFDPSSNSAIAVTTSSNGGGSWSSVMVDSAVYPNVDQFSDVAVASDGTVGVSWMRCSATGPTGDCGGTQAHLMFSKSTDGGATWSAPVVMAKPHLAPDSCGAFYGCLPNTSERVSDIPAMDYDRSSGPFAGYLYSTLYNYVKGQMRVMLVRSTNGGATWSAPIRVSPGAANDEFFPWLTTAHNGDVGVTWLDRRMDPSNIKYDAFAAVSTNGGTSFGASVRVSTVSSDPFMDGFGGGFMGDYTGNIWDRNKLFQSWPDTRTGVAQDEVGAYKI
jgi:hypothetical protein